MFRLRNVLIASTSVAALFVLGCPAEPPPAPTPAPAAAPEPAPPPAAPPLVAVAQLAAAEGGTVTGTVTFTEQDGAVHVVAEVAGLAAGPHGLHLHEGAECVGDFSSAGGHFNPGATEHGAPDAPAHHGGDFGNVEIGADGTGRVDITASGITVAAGPSSVVGHAVIVHADPDDFVTQPTGNAGARVACGVVTLEGDDADAVVDPTDEPEGEGGEGGGTEDSGT